MTNSSKTDLAPIWADATPLSDYLDQRTRSALRVGEQDQGNEVSPASSMLLGVAAALQTYGNTPRVIEETKKKTNDDLIAGRISAIGRKENSGRFVALEASHWIGSEIHWHSNAMKRGRAAYVDIRVIDQGQSADSQFEQGVEYRDTFEVVEAAIAKYAADDPNLSDKPEIRYRAYREFIRARGFDPHRDRGFSEKTFEAYETKFRKKNNAK